MADTDNRPSSPVDDNLAVGAAKAAARPQLRSGSSNPNMNGPLYMQTSGSNVVLVRKLKRKDEGTWKHLTSWLVENQIGMFKPSAATRMCKLCWLHSIWAAINATVCPKLTMV